ncbi:S-adenosyl-L-methionine-dependent methyltransferase [Trichoderma asperelloides]|nr:S-adenosyl-L-methionine-dependent methyltransferase [Trichoderma asperelloides]
MTSWLTIIDSLKDDEVQFLTSRTAAARGRSRASSSATLGRESDDDNEEPEVEEVAELFDEEVIDLTGHDLEIGANSLLREGELPLERYREPSSEVRDVQLGAYEVDFVRIQVIARGRNGDCNIRGVPFVRTRKLQGKLGKKVNEICMICHVWRQNDGKELPAIPVSVPLPSIVKRRDVIFTNTIYPEHCCTGNPALSRDLQQRRAELNGSLVCRWKFTIYFTMNSQSRATRPEEEVLERVQVDEVPMPKYRVPDETLCNRWRGGRIKGGSWPQNATKIIDLESQPLCTGMNPNVQSRRIGQKYTLFDSFSGAGGVSRGAQSAGFKVQYALFRMPIDDFILTTKDRLMRADVLHLSPPCQYFSPAHTHQSVHDDANIFALFGSLQLIDKLRPRLVTLEQTFGITHERHRQYLRALIGCYTQHGYSVRWKVVRLCTWGLAQDRKRLIILAAAPGEKLPPFPNATHSEDGVGGLKPYTTIRKAISSIRIGDDLHNLDNVKHFQPRRPPLDADGLAGTITTGGNDVYYPDGTRDFTIREYACIQGFPKYHKFLGTKTCIRRQIGNAFPSNTVQMLYKHLEEWLLKQDGMTRYQPVADSVMIVDDSDNDESDDSFRWQTSSVAYSSPEMDEDVMEIVNLPDRPRYIHRRDSCVIDLI